METRLFKDECMESYDVEGDVGLGMVTKILCCYAGKICRLAYIIISDS